MASTSPDNNENVTPACLEPNSCAPWCKCITCREKDYLSFEQMEENCDRLSDWIEVAMEKLSSIKQLYAHSLEVWKEIQDKYAGESFDNKQRFITGATEEVEADGKAVKGKTE